MCDVIAVQVGRRTYMPCLQVPFPTANGRKEKIASSLLSPFVATSRQLKSRSPAEATPSYSSRIRRPGTMIHQGHHCEVHPTHWGFGSVR